MSRRLRAFWAGALALCAALVVGAEPQDEYLRLGSAVQSPRLRETIDALSKAPSRVTGSTGEAAAFDLIERRLRRLGAQNVRRELFDVAVPDPDARGRLSVGSRSIDVWPLWPNHVRPSTCDVSGPIVYVASGSLEAMRGRKLQGAIALMEFDSGGRWKNAAKLGASAIVFLESRTMARGEAEMKFSSVPITIPRFYLPLRDAGPVLRAAFANASGRLSCRQNWVARKSANLVAEFPGTGSESITLSAYVDSTSLAPGIAPGASQACGAASALELAEIYAHRPHRRTLRFVFSGGHFSALRGARAWVSSRLEKGDDPGLVDVSLDLSAGSRALGVYARGWFYEYRDESILNLKPLGRSLRAHAERLAKALDVDPPKKILVDAINNGDGRTWKNNIPGKFALDCEPKVMAGMNAITLATIEDARDEVDTPHDTIDRLDFSNLARQTHVVAVLLHHLLDDTSRLDSTSEFRVPVAPSRPSSMTLVGGFATLDGQVVRYEPQKSFIPDTPVRDAIVTVDPRQKTMMGVRGTITSFTTGDRADYRLEGVAPKTAYPQDQPQITRVSAFHIDPTTGAIDFAPTYGHYGDESYPIMFTVKTASRTSPIVTFPCVSIDFYDLVDPQELTAFRRFVAFDANSAAFPDDYYVTEPPFDVRMNPDVEDCQTLFTVPRQKYFFFAGSFVDTRLSLINAAPGQEKGLGYVAPEKGSVVFPDTSLSAARDLASLNRTRLAKFRKYRIVSPGVEDLSRQAETAIATAERDRAAADWPAFERSSRAAWALALRAYPIVKDTANDVVNGVVFYLFLLIPFAYFLERLTVGSESVARQIGFAGAYFMGAFVLLRFVHPAFEIVTNPTMIFVGFVMGTLSLLVITFILGKFEGSMRVVKRAQGGSHDVDVRRSSVAMAAFNLGVGNMRRRKARTFLTTLTLVVMTFIVLSFSSIVPEVTLNEFPSDTPARYGGLLLRNPGLEPMQLATYRQVANEFGSTATVARRATYYGADVGSSGVLTLQRGDQTADVRVMAGFDPDETAVLRPQEALLPGGRWFRDGETDAMILPQPVAEQLRIDPKEVGKATVTFGGAAYRVIGVLDAGLFRSIVDLDGDGIAPADFALSKRFQEEGLATNKAFRSYVRIDPASVFLLPSETALRLGADLRSIGVGFKDVAATRPALQSLMPRLRMNLYASVQSPKSNRLEIRQFSVLQGSKGVGVGLVIVQLLIASVFVLNTMIASVVERTREIAIFSSIGLAPGHIAALFFAESLVYGVLGSVFGYFAAQIAAKILVSTGAVPGLTLNFSSTSAVMSAGLVMGVVLLSTIYPALKASQIAAPGADGDSSDQEPEGDAWEIALPFSIDTVEAPAVIEFLAEWLRGYEGFTIGEFVTAETVVAHREHEDVVACTAWLAPYDLGVSQRVELVAAPSAAPNVSSLTLRLTRLSGDPENWITVNRRFGGVIRRQFLTWRTIPREARELYRPEARIGA